MTDSDEARGVTVCIPTLNECETIERVLAGIDRQTSPPVETIVVDGGSTDGTRDIARRHGATVIKQDGGGLGAARNQGFELCETPIFATIDGDAVPSDQWLEVAVDVLTEHDVAGVGAEIEEMGSSPSARWRTRRMPFNSRDSTGPIDRIPGNNIVFRSERLDEIGGWDESFEFANEDIDLCKRFREAGHELYYTPRTNVNHFGVTGIEVVEHLWLWHSPEGGPDTVKGLLSRSMEHVGKSLKYTFEDIFTGNVTGVPLDLAIIPVHMKKDLDHLLTSK